MTQNRQNVTKKRDFYEKKAWITAQSIIGIDEVGRGCLAGPVLAAAVILPPKTRYNRLIDSKKMTKKEREIAYKWIIKNCNVGIGIAHHRLIDKHNIYQATIIAMKKALSALISITFKNPDIILVDAVTEKFTDIINPKTIIYSFKNGEDRSRSIAAASIVAKVTRDKIMDNLHATYRQYHFNTHKGYGTKQHIALLDVHGESIVHRKTFLQNYYQKKHSDMQQALF